MNDHTQSTNAMPLNAIDMAREIHAGRLRARDVVSAALARIDALQASLNAFVTVCHESALAQADAVDAAIQAGQAVGR